MLHCWYFDDGIIAGTEEILCEALKILRVSRVECGLEPREDEREPWSVECMIEMVSSRGTAGK